MSEDVGQDDGIFWPTLKVGGSAGAAGLLVGGTVGILRSAHPALWAVTTGFQWTLLGSTYWSLRSVILKSRVTDTQSAAKFTPKTKESVSAISGGLSAAIVGGVLRGRNTIIPGTIVGSVLGYLGQKGYDVLDQEHTVALQAEREPDRTRAQKEPLWMRAVTSKFSPVTLISDEDYRKVLEEKLLKVDVEIGVIDDDIAALKKSAEAGSTQEPS